MLRDHLKPVKDTDIYRELIDLTENVALSRPKPLREYDQIWMRGSLLLDQTFIIAPYLEDKRVVFLGDGDCMSLMLGICGVKSYVKPPEHMTVLDFDKRLLNNIQVTAQEHGIGQMITTIPYNVLDPLPTQLLGMADWIYANPPYGFSNQGMSATIWLSRCVELCKPRCSGCLILPYDANREEAQIVMRAVQEYLIELGFVICDMAQQVHKYHLDDDPPLASSVLIANRDFPCGQVRHTDRIEESQASCFYGRSVKPPYPRYIERDGSHNYDWECA